MSEPVKRNNERIRKAAMDILERFKPETRLKMFLDLNIPREDAYKQLYEFMYDTIIASLAEPKEEPK